MENKKFNVLGVYKSGTSTVTGILNCHPDIFCYFERRPDGKLKSNYPKLKRDYIWVGDKNPRLGSFKQVDERIKMYEGDPVIFCYRDVQKWLCHSYIRKRHKTDVDVVQPTIDYLYYLLRSFDFKNIERIRLESLLDDPGPSLDRIGKLLGVDSLYFENWWDKVGNFSDQNKLARRWWIGHNCAVKKPTIDICVDLLPHEFWNIVLPIIKNPEQFIGFDVRQLKSFGKLPLVDVVRNFKHTRISGA